METIEKSLSDHRPGGIREMLAIALPMIVSQSCDTLMIFTDRLFLSRLGSEPMSAAMSGGLFSFLYLTLFFGLINYVSAQVAQHLGAGEKEKTSLAVTQAAIIAVLAWPLLIALRPLAHHFFVLSGITEGQRVLQEQFFNILVLASGISLLRAALSGFFTGIGRTRVVMVSMAVALIVNATMSWILIFGHGPLEPMGIRGAAYGTVIGGIAGFLVLLWAYFSPRYRIEYGVAQSFRYCQSSMLRLLKFGYPAGIELFLNLLAFNAIVLLFHGLGESTASAATIMFNWDMVSFLPLIGIEVAVVSLVGRYVGAERPDLARKAAASGLSLTWGYAAVIFILFLGVPGQLVDVFTPQHDTGVFAASRDLAIFMIQVAALYVFANGIMVVFAGALRGAGDTLWCMVFMVLMHWVLVAGLYGALHLFHLGPRIGWFILVVLFLVFPAVLWLRWRSGKWEGLVTNHGANVAAPEIVVVEEEGFHSGRDI